MELKKKFENIKSLLSLILNRYLLINHSINVGIQNEVWNVENESLQSLTFNILDSSFLGDKYNSHFLFYLDAGFWRQWCLKCFLQVIHFMQILTTVYAHLFLFLILISFFEVLKNSKKWDTTQEMKILEQLSRLSCAQS